MCMLQIMGVAVYFSPDSLTHYFGIIRNVNMGCTTFKTIDTTMVGKLKIYNKDIFND